MTEERLIFISGSAAGDVAFGALLFVVGVSVASIGFLLPLGVALLWFGLCGYVFVALHLRSGSRTRPGRTAAILRMRPLGSSLKWIVMGAPLMIVLGVSAGGLVQLWAGPVHSPIAPSGPNSLEELAGTRNGWLLLMAYAAVLGPVIEEFCFRGWIQRPLERRTGPALAILSSAAVFAVAHLWYGNVGFLIVPFILGVVWGSAVYVTDSIWAGVLLHGIWNGSMMISVGLAADPGSIFLLPESRVEISFLAAVTVGALLTLFWIGRQATGRGRDGQIEAADEVAA